MESSSEITNLDLEGAYHKLITNIEVPKVSQGMEGPPYTIHNLNYYLKIEEILRVLRDKFPEDKAVKVFQKLIDKGFLIEIEKGKYRSLHMDVLVRSAAIRTMWSYEEYILSPRFNIYSVPLPDERDRSIKPKISGNVISRRLHAAIESFFGNKQLSTKYLEIIADYLGRDKWGLDPFQAQALSELLLSGKKVHVLTAPTGSGKTIIFTFYILARLMRAKSKGLIERAILVYPRRILSINQAGRIIRLLYTASKHGFNFSFGLRDSATPREKEFKPGTPFREIKCPRCGGKLVYWQTKKRLHAVKCEKCNTEYDFILSSRSAMGRNPPDIIVTNMWALETRLMDSNVKDLNVNHLSNVGVVIIDEAHEYTGLSAGLVSVLIRLLSIVARGNFARDAESWNSTPTIIFSSATIPSPVEFAAKIIGTRIEGVVHHDFFKTISDVGGVKGKRLVILGLFDMSPNYSWSTYAQLWAVMMTFINYTYTLDEKKFRPQSIIFINNIKELRRTIRGYEESINLGEPRDHIIGPEGKKLTPLDPYMYTHYPSPETLLQIENGIKIKGKLPELLGKTAPMHSQASSEDRQRVISALEGKGDIAVVFSTSSLELGIDYENVSFILNIGLENPISLAQRIGRGGRSSSCLRTVLGILITKNIPKEAFILHDVDIWERLNPAPRKFSLGLPVAVENPQVLKRNCLTNSITKLALDGENTYASGPGLKSITSLKNYLQKIRKKLAEIAGWVS